LGARAGYPLIRLQALRTWPVQRTPMEYPLLSLARHWFAIRLFQTQIDSEILQNHKNDSLLTAKAGEPALP